MKDKKIFSWVMYDWANSAYATIVLAGFYPIIFAENFASLFSDVERTLVLGISNSSASLLLIILAPLIGLISDRRQDKKNFLIFFAIISILSTLFLSFVGKDSWMLASLLFSISLFGFMLSNVFYDSMLVNFESLDKNYDSISSYGYAIGYLGGGIAFVLSLLFLFYFNDSTIALITEKKIVFIFTAFWWLLFMIPLMLYWKNNNSNISSDKINIIDTYRYVKNDKRLLYFLFAYWIYIDGVDTIIRMAVNYGMTIGFTSSDLLIALLVTQFVSFPGTLLINKLANYYTIDISIKLCLIVYIIITFISFNLTSIYEFYLIAILIGIVQGGIQALSRSYYARLIPKNRSSELYGVYNMLGKFAALVGPLVVGFVSYLFDSTRIGILSLSLFFIFGIYLFNKQSKI